MFKNISENSIGNQEIPPYQELYQDLCAEVALGDALYIRYSEVITRKSLSK